MGKQGEKWLTEECDDCRLTELGARVLEIIESTERDVSLYASDPTMLDETHLRLRHKLLAAARSLGLLLDESEGSSRRPEGPTAQPKAERLGEEVRP
jgi:hypothetical protein